jgi:hypothetical protein
MNTQLLTMRELHHRVSDGIHVRLLWCEDAGKLAVSVTDSRTGAAFCVEVHEGESALDVFNHPFAYAAWHGIDTAAPPAPDQREVSLAA